MTALQDAERNAFEIGRDYERGLTSATGSRSRISVEPMELQVTQTFEETGLSTNFWVVYNGDLSVKSHARDIVRSAEEGALVIGLMVDGDHDEVHWVPTGGSDGEEVIRRGLEVLTIALEAVRRAKR